ncbi:unnamed protein product [Spirodela intermedia]|uniref:Uncharacterized protein n=1 Tax=Spirodela intermedia TaxID=51605 RepID=A0A7I8J171_SPIIN|nr:unnamed protein product [Spirodela intermedia]CAA6663976.1 unnamed protein product [Spirodela intermedia]
MLDSPKRAAPIFYRTRQLLTRLLPWDHRGGSRFLLRLMANFAAERALLVSRLRSIRWISVVVGIGNLGVSSIGVYLLASMSSECSVEKKLPFVVATIVAGVRIMSMVGAAFAQMKTAASVASCLSEGSIAVDAVVRHERRVRYKRWLWWTRFGTVITMSQIVGAVYLTIITVKYLSYNTDSVACFLVQKTERSWKRGLIIFFPILVWGVVILQCFTGSDVLRWRSFYATHDTAWKAHYHEVFDHGIREALCCLGRVKYLSVLEEDEVYSVARLLGDLVAYRASGTGHLELLAGLALLQRQRQISNFGKEPVEAPEALIQEAAVLHQFAEAAYTGLLLDFGRNPIFFPCAWLYRQGVLTPWMRCRRPMLEGDNWWRGHAAAFLKYVNMPPEVLRRGRVSQVRREAAYFIVVLHHVKTVVIAVRGTETPEDLITDGLCKECVLSADDLDGLLHSDHLPSEVRQGVLSSFPHYGHSGIVESARELFIQIDGQPGNEDAFPSESAGFLSSLLGMGCECQGYKIRIIGHSLGGAVGTMLGIRLYRRYPNLRVYSYGTLPCVDRIVADACSEFVTSVVYNDEFSARLSVNSIIRLRAAAMTALSENSSPDSAMIHKVVRRILQSNRAQGNGDNENVSSSSHQPAKTVHENSNQRSRRKRIKFTVKGGVFLCSHALTCLLYMPSHSPCKTLRNDVRMLESNGVSDLGGCTFNAGSGGHNHDFLHREESHLIDGDCSRALEDFNDEDVLEQADGETAEMFLPGLIIHIVPEQGRSLSLWSWRIQHSQNGYRALLADREDFKDIAVTPYMFLDHLPWRCYDAMHKALETKRSKDRLDANLLNGENIV